MAQAHWLKARNGNFDTAADWSTGTAPGKGDDVLLDAKGKAYTVSVTASEDVNSLTLSSNATLSITGASAGSAARVFMDEDHVGGSSANGGKINVGNNATFRINGTTDETYVNTGEISLNAKGANSFLDIVGSGAQITPSMAFYGGGVISMSDNFGNGIIDSNRFSDRDCFIDNIDNTIQGAGVIGDGGFSNGVSMDFENGSRAVIDATGTNNALMLDLPTVVDVTPFGTYAYGGLVNAGLIEATGAAGLDIAATTVANDGTILAANGSIVRLESAVIQGGLLATSGTGIVLASGGSTIDGSSVDGAVTNAGVLQVFGETMYAQGQITNTGAIKLSDQVSAAVMQVGEGVLTLSGGGSVTLSDFLGNAIQGASSDSALLNIDNVISGAGQIGGGGLIMANNAAGVIDATGTYNTLKLYAPALSFVNSGLVEASGKAGLELAALTLDQRGGGRVSVAAGSIARLEGATVLGGSLTNAVGGQIISSGGSSLTGVAVNNQGLLSVVDGDVLNLAGSITNGGMVSLTGTASAAHLMLTGNLSLSGGGKVLLGEGGSIDSAAAGDTFTNVDNQITGDGDLGGGATQLVNQTAGTIVETGTSGLTLDAATFANAGMLEAAGTGDVSVLSAVTNSGVLRADAGSMMSLVSAVRNNGQLIANGGTLIAYQAVSGTGSASIAGGLLDFTLSFSQNVSFTGAAGVLELGKSRNYAGTVSGFSKTGGTAFDLGDIKFVGAGEASFSGSSAGGVLTVSDGAHTAHIALVGDFTAAAFTAARDGHGGVLIKATTPAAQNAASAAGFVDAMAGLGAAPVEFRPAAGAPTTAIATLVAPASHGLG